MGLFATPEQASRTHSVLPKVALVCEPKDYIDTGGDSVKKQNMDLVARIMSVGKLHRSYAITGAIATAGAALIEGTVVHDVCEPIGDEIRIGHPSGVMRVLAKMDRKSNAFIYREAVIGRTARRLMEGWVCVPENCLSSYDFTEVADMLKESTMKKKGSAFYQNETGPAHKAEHI